MTERISARSAGICFEAAVLASVLGLTACGSDIAPTTGASTGGAGGGGPSSQSAAAGSGGAAAGSTQAGKPLVWDDTGFVAPDTNAFAIQGPFYFYSDCDPPSGLPCTMPDAALMGADTKPGWSVDKSQVCAKGTAVQVQNQMFSLQWGAGLALDLNSKGGTPAVKGTFDLQHAGIRGFSIDITGTAPASIRINLTMPNLPDSSFVTAKIPGTTTFNIADAKQGSFVMTKTPLDATRVEAIQFQVFTTAGAPTPYDFCISAIRVIADADPPAAAAGTGGGG